MTIRSICISDAISLNREENEKTTTDYYTEAEFKLEVGSDVHELKVGSAIKLPVQKENKDSLTSTYTVHSISISCVSIPFMILLEVK